MSRASNVMEISLKLGNNWLTLGPGEEFRDFKPLIIFITNNKFIACLKSIFDNMHDCIHVKFID